MVVSLGIASSLAPSRSPLRSLTGSDRSLFTELMNAVFNALASLRQPARINNSARIALAQHRSLARYSRSCELIGERSRHRDARAVTRDAIVAATRCGV